MIEGDVAVSGVGREAQKAIAMRLVVERYFPTVCVCMGVLDRATRVVVR